MSTPADAEGEFERRYEMTLDEAYELLYPKARYLTGDRDEAAELLNGFLSQHLGRLTGTAPVRNPAAFLRISLAHHRIDVLRAEMRRRRQEAPHATVPETIGTAAPSALPAPVLRLWMASVIGRDDADLVWRHVVDGETQARIADQAGEPPSTIGDRIRHALQRLRESLEEDA